jgi:hypothetical protein
MVNLHRWILHGGNFPSHKVGHITDDLETLDISIEVEVSILVGLSFRWRMSPCSGACAFLSSSTRCGLVDRFTAGIDGKSLSSWWSPTSVSGTQLDCGRQPSSSCGRRPCLTTHSVKLARLHASGPHYLVSFLANGFVKLARLHAARSFAAPVNILFRTYIFQNSKGEKSLTTPAHTSLETQSAGRDPHTGLYIFRNSVGGDKPTVRTLSMER